MTISAADALAWLEVDDDSTTRWQEEQTTRAVTAVRGDPLWAHLVRAIDRGAVAGGVRAPTLRGDLRFAVSPDGEPRINVEDSAGNREELRPSVVAGSRLHRIWPSPSGALVAVGWLAGGAEEGVLRVVDRSGQAKSGDLAFSTLTEVAWIPGEDGFLFNAPNAERSRVAIWSYDLESKSQLLEPVATEGLFNVPQVSADGRWAAVVVGARERRPEWILDRVSGTSWSPFLGSAPGHWLGEFVGDSYIAVTTHLAPRGRLVAIRLPFDGHVESVTDLVPESPAVLRAVQRSGSESLALSEYHEGACRIRFVDLDGNDQGNVNVLEAGTLTRDTTAPPLIGEPMVAADSTTETVGFVHSSYRRSPGIYLHGRRTGIEVLRESALVNDHLTVTNLSAEADDGVEIPVHVISRSEDATRPAPTLLTAYGGFNVATLPRYLSWIEPFVALGAKVAFALVRGGAEFGQEWWQAALRRHKQRTFDDLYAAAEHLIASRTALPGLGLYGASHGGLVTAVAATQRPDLFRVVAAIGSIYDMVNFTNDPITAAIVTDEYGDPAIAEERAVLASYSPVHHPTSLCPATFIAAPAQDVRCPPWHSRKLAAALQSAAPDQEIVLRIWGSMGHAGGNAETSPAQRHAEWLSFIGRHLGLTPST